MNFQKKLSKKISFLLLISVLSINLYSLSVPQKVEADSLTDSLQLIGTGIDSISIAPQIPLLGPSLIPANPLGSIMTLNPSQYLETKKQDIWTQIGKFAGDAGILLAKQAARELISQITDETIKWINGLGTDGNQAPSFYSDWKKFLGNVADQAVGDYISSDPNLQFLCDPFKLQIKEALSVNLNNSVNLFKGSNCSLTAVTTNVKNAVASGSASI
jgi:hypothetical protein